MLTMDLRKQDWGARVLDNGFGSLVYQDNNQNHFAVYSKSAGLGWGIIATVPESELLRPAQRTRNITLGLCILSLLACEIIILAVTRSVTRPLRIAINHLDDTVVNDIYSSLQ